MPTGTTEAKNLLFRMEATSGAITKPKGVSTKRTRTKAPKSNPRSTRPTVARLFATTRAQTANATQYPKIRGSIDLRGTTLC